MWIKCKSTLGKDVPEKQRFFGESVDADYSPLVMGESYFVYAIIFYTHRIDYLLSPGDCPPMWAPSCLFSIEDPQLGCGFFTAVIDKDSQFDWLHDTYGARFIVGYQEITESFEHFVGVVERNEADLVKFSEQKLIHAVSSLKCNA